MAETQYITKLQGNLKEPKLSEVFSLGVFISWDVFLLFLIFFSTFYSWQVEMEQKKSLKPDFEGEEVENPKECGVQ